MWLLRLLRWRLRDENHGGAFKEMCEFLKVTEEEQKGRPELQRWLKVLLGFELNDDEQKLVSKDRRNISMTKLTDQWARHLLPHILDRVFDHGGFQPRSSHCHTRSVAPILRRVLSDGVTAIYAWCTVSFCFVLILNYKKKVKRLVSLLMLQVEYALVTLHFFISLFINSFFFASVPIGISCHLNSPRSLLPSRRKGHAAIVTATTALDLGLVGAPHLVGPLGPQQPRPLRRRATGHLSCSPSTQAVGRRSRNSASTIPSVHDCSVANAYLQSYGATAAKCRGDERC